MSNKLTNMFDISKFSNSPFSDFINDFFNDSLPIQLINRQESYPKYNILRENKNITDKFTIELSLAGFSKDSLKIYTENGILFVESDVAAYKDVDYLYKGIAERNFKWSIKLPQYAQVDKTSYINGLLSIDIIIKIPDEKKPKYYEIK